MVRPPSDAAIPPPPFLHQTFKVSGNQQNNTKVYLALDSGMVVVIFIVVLLLTLLFTMFSSVDNNWCNLLFPNGTENIRCMPGYYEKKAETLNENVEIKYFK